MLYVGSFPSLEQSLEKTASVLLQHLRVSPPGQSNIA